MRITNIAPILASLALASACAAGSCGRSPASDCRPRCAADSCGDDGCGGTCLCGPGRRCDSATAQCLACETPDCTPANDTCSSPQLLLFDQGVATAAGDTATARGDLLGPCGGEGGDVVYRVVLPEESTLTAQVAPDSGSALAPVLYLQRPCQQGAVVPGYCARAAAGAPATLFTPRLSDEWFLIVDSADVGGPFHLAVTLGRPDPAPESDACSSATELLLDAAGTATVQADNRWARDDTTGTCGAFNGPDLVYRVHLVARSRLSARVEGIGFGPALYLRRDCSSALPADELACAAPIADASSFDVALNAGDVFLFVDCAAFSFGAFSLQVTVAPLNDACGGAFALALDDDGRARVLGDTRGAHDEASASCNLAPGPDVFFTVWTPSAGRLRARVFPDSAEPSLHPAVTLRAACPGAPTDELACATGTAGAMATADVSAGLHWIGVEGASNTAGPFTLDLVFGSPPANDGCDNVAALTFDGSGVSRASGDLALASKDLSPACAIDSGGDLVYSFALDSAAPVVATVTPRAGDPFLAALHLRSACEGAVEACSVLSDAGAAVVRATRLVAGTHYLVVDAPGVGGGGFDLEVWALDRDDAGRCTSPILLTLDPVALSASHRFDTSLGRDSSAGACGGAGAPEAVYAVNLKYWTDLEVRVEPGPGSQLRPIIYGRYDCNRPADDTGAHCAAGADRQAASLSLPALRPGLHFLFVDGADASSGSYTLSVSGRRSPGRPEEETCATARELVFDWRTGSARVVESVSDVADDLEEGYAPIGAGDLVYRFHLAQESVVRVRLESTAGEAVQATLLSSCPGGVLMATASASNGGFPEPAYAQLSRGDYWLVVELGPPATGSFVLEVTASNFIGGEDCARPIDLLFDALGSATMIEPIPMASDASPRARRYTGSDLVYRIALDQPATLSFEMTGGAGSQPLLYLRAECASAESEIAYAEAVSGTVRLDGVSLPAGTWFLWADELQWVSMATVTLQASLTHEVPTSANDGCATAASLEFDTAGHAQVAGSTAGALDDFVLYPGTLGIYPGRDVVYAFNLPAAAQVTATVSATWAGARAVLLNACPPVTALDMDGVGGALNLSAGPHWVVVDGESTASGNFVLDLTQAVPLVIPDTCATATPLTFDANGRATVSGTLVGATDSGGPATPYGTDWSGPDVVYALDVADSDLVISASVSGGSWSREGGLYLMRGCRVAGEQEVAFSRGRSMSVIASVAAGRWYLWLDTTGGTNPPTSYSLTVQRSSRQGPRTCEAPERLELDGNGAVVVSANGLFGAGWLRPASCEAEQRGESVSVVYALTLPTEKAATIELTVPSPLLGPTVSVRRECADERTEWACMRLDQPARTTFPRLAAGTWYVIVSESWWVGDYELRVTTQAPNGAAPANDGCGGATVVVPDRSGVADVQGTLVDATNDHQPGCAAASGVDVAYRVVTTGATRLVAEVEAYPGFHPVVSVASSCGAAASAELACGRTQKGLAAATAVVGAGTSYVWVDSEGAAPGPFRLHLSATPAGEAPENDTCLGAEPLFFVNGVARAAGTSVGARIDTAGSWWERVGDVVYQFDLAAPSRVRANLRLDVGLPANTGLMLRQECANRTTSAEEICRFDSPPAVMVPRAAAGSWFVWVQAESRPFHLDVLLDPPAPSPVNDRAAGALPIRRGGVVYGDTSDADPDYGDDGLGGACSQSAEPRLAGRDLVYRYAPTSSGPFQVRFDQRRFVASLWVTPAERCGEAASCLAVTSDALFGAQVQGVLGAEYCIVVDGYRRQDYGPFAIQVQ